MEERDRPTQEQIDQWHDDPKNWKLFFFYYNPQDKRLFPPKRIKWMGWTINFANPFSIVILVLLIVVIVFVVKKVV